MPTSLNLMSAAQALSLSNGYPTMEQSDVQLSTINSSIYEAARVGHQWITKAGLHAVNRLRLEAQGYKIESGDHIVTIRW